MQNKPVKLTEGYFIYLRSQWYLFMKKYSLESVNCYFSSQGQK